MRAILFVIALAPLLTCSCDDVRTLGGPATVRVPIPKDMQDRGLLGLSIDWQGDNESQLVVTGVLPGSTPDQAGIEPGDIVVQIDDARINSIDDLNGLATYLKPNQIVVVEILRDGRTFTFDIRLMSYTEVVQLQMLQETANPSNQKKSEDR